MIVDPVKLPFTRLRPGMRMRPLGPTFPLGLCVMKLAARLDEV
jgi:hypothetical protein